MYDPIDAGRCYNVGYIHFRDHSFLFINISGKIIKICWYNNGKIENLNTNANTFQE